MSVNQLIQVPVLKTVVTQEKETFEYIANLLDAGYMLFSKDFVRQSKNKVVYPASNELQIDIDSEEAFEAFERRIIAFKTYFKCTETITPSKSGLPKRHILISVLGCSVKPVYLNGVATIRPKEFTNIERVAWQAILGSDPAREFLSMIHIEENDPNPILFEELLPKE
jgi:hypothetical protein